MRQQLAPVCQGNKHFSHVAPGNPEDAACRRTGYEDGVNSCFVDHQPIIHLQQLRFQRFLPAAGRIKQKTAPEGAVCISGLNFESDALATTQHRGARQPGSEERECERLRY